MRLWTQAEPNNPAGWGFLGSPYALGLNQSEKAIAPAEALCRFAAHGPKLARSGRYLHLDSPVRRCCRCD